MVNVWIYEQVTEDMIMTQHNNYSPGGCSMESIIKSFDEPLQKLECPVCKAALAEHNDWQLEHCNKVNGLAKTHTKKDIQNAVDVVVESFARTTGKLTEEIHALEEYNRDLELNYRDARQTIQKQRVQNDKWIEELKRLGDLNRELHDKIQAYSTLVHAREYLRHNSYTVPMQKAIIILNNSLIDMEG